MFLPTELDDLTPEAATLAAEMADFEKMESIRARVDATVDNKETAEALKPWYRQFCKRPTFSDDYLPTFNLPNVTLVDTNGRGVSRIVAEGITVGDTTYEVDLIVYASGFEVGTSYARRAGFETVGRDGVTLTEKWSGGPKTFYGFQSVGFPNSFFMGLTQTGLTPNFSQMLHEQAEHIAYLIGSCNKRGCTVIEATQEAEDAWQEEMAANALATREFFESCTPGYYNNEGHFSEKEGLTSAAYGAGSEAFFRIIREWRALDDLNGVTLS